MKIYTNCVKATSLHVKQKILRTHTILCFIWIVNRALPTSSVLECSIEIQMWLKCILQKNTLNIMYKMIIIFLIFFNIKCNLVIMTQQCERIYSQVATSLALPTFKRGPIRGRDIYNQAGEPSSLPSNRAASSSDNNRQREWNRK